MTDIYNAEALPPTNVEQQQQQAPALTLPDEVAALVGPGKKYATLELALKSIPAAQAHIAKLEAEHTELRQKADGALTTETVYATVQELLKAQEKPSVVAGLDEAAVASIFDRQLEARNKAEREAQNVAAFKSVFDKTFGEKAKETFAAKAAEVNMTPAELSDLLKKTPEAALRLVGLKGPAPAQGHKVQSSVNTEVFDHNQRPPTEKRNLISGGAKRSELKAAWQETVDRVNKANGIQ